MFLHKSSFMVLIAAMVAVSVPQKAQASTPLALIGLAATGAALTGAGYLEWKSIKDESSEKTWNRAGWTASSLITAPLVPLSWFCTYKAVKGKDWGKRLLSKIGATVLLGTGTFVLFGTAYLHKLESLQPF